MKTDKAREATDAKKLTLVVLLDLSKAFEGTCTVVQQIKDDSKRNLENSFLNHFLSAKRVTYCRFYLYYYNFNV